MVDQELNFKKFSTEKHRVHRLMRAPSHMLQTYRYLINEIGSYRSALIFPEQFLLVNEQNFYAVTAPLTPSDSISIKINQYEPCKVFTVGKANRIRTYEKIIDAEQNSSSDAPAIFSLGRTEASPKIPLNRIEAKISIPNSWSEPKSSENFTCFFINKSDAIKFARSKIILA